MYTLFSRVKLITMNFPVIIIIYWWYSYMQWRRTQGRIQGERTRRPHPHPPKIGKTNDLLA